MSTGIQPHAPLETSDPPHGPSVGGTYPVSMHVQGMDCSSCVGKIETALQRLPGVSDIRLNFATTRLDLRLEETARTQPDDIARLIRSLGFQVAVEDRHAHHAHHSGHEHSPASHAGPGQRRWWRTQAGRQVLALGSLMGGAYVVAQFVPEYGEWVFALAVIAGVLPFVRQAWALARSGTPFSIEMLMSVAAIGALAIGEAEEAAAVVFLFSLGELLEGVAAGRARAGIRALSALVPEQALRIDAAGAQHTVAASMLQPGDTILVRPGDRMPADGVVIEGRSTIDTSPLTGESMPQAREPGDPVFAGVINIDGALHVRVEKAGAENMIARIIHLVEQAQANKAPVARFIERFSRWYTPAVMAIAALTVIVPPLFLGADWLTWVYRGLALLLIACPCALVLSTPAAVASALAAGTRSGLLVKGGRALEMIGRVKAVAFDKTGTLTAGRPQVTDVIPLDTQTEHDILALAASVEATSSHPLAHAIVGHAAALGIDVPVAQKASAVAGAAAHALVHGRTLAIGSPAYAGRSVHFTVEQVERVEALQRDGKTVTVLFDEQAGTALGLLALRDEPRPDAKAAVARLKAMGVRPVMLTGDHALAGQAIAAGLGLECVAQLLPADKQRFITQLKAQGGVAMVGDGINDAPALAAADVGIAMGSGTDVALETADAALLENRVLDVVRLVALSRATLANIRQNVIVALGLKGVFLVTTMLGITGLWVAVLADTGATAIVTLNALRLLGAHRLR